MNSKIDPKVSAADFLANLRAEPKHVPALPAAICPEDLTTAYQVQDLLVDRLLHKQGGQRIGYKIACTNEIAQRQLHINAPLFGQLLLSSTYSTPAVLKPSDFLVRIIEVEFAFQIAQAVPVASALYTKESIADFVAVALPGIEIVSHHYEDWAKVGAPSIAADNAIHGAWIRGAPYADWRALDLAQHKAQLTVNGKTVRQGQGTAVLGHPLNVVAWLANELPRYGKQLKAGDFITTGVISEIYMAQPGDQLRADFGRLGAVALTFTE
ncbi:2-keto-4-pentenoate hydratase [soil metagenome]